MEREREREWHIAHHHRNLKVNPNLGIEREREGEGEGESDRKRETSLRKWKKKSQMAQQDLCKASYALWTKLFWGIPYFPMAVVRREPDLEVWAFACNFQLHLPVLSFCAVCLSHVLGLDFFTRQRPSSIPYIEPLPYPEWRLWLCM